MKNAPAILPLAFIVPDTLTPVPVIVIVVLPAAATVTFPLAVAMYTLLFPFANAPMKLLALALPVTAKLVSVPKLVMFGCAAVTSTADE